VQPCRIARLAAACGDAGGDVRRRVRGGKAIDTAKGVARPTACDRHRAQHRLERRADRRLIVVYGEDGAIAEVLYTSSTGRRAGRHRDHRRGAGTLSPRRDRRCHLEEIRGRARCRFRRAQLLQGAAVPGGAHHRRLLLRGDPPPRRQRRRRRAPAGGDGATGATVEANILLSGLSFESAG